MFLQQRQRCHTTVLHDFIFRNDGDVDQRKSAAVKPVLQRQLFMSGVEVALHRRHRVAQQPERHMSVRRGLVLYQLLHIAVIAASGFQAEEHVAEAGMQIIFHERAGGQPERAEVADSRQLGGERWISIKSRATSGWLRNCLKTASCGVGVLFSSSSLSFLTLKKTTHFSRAEKKSLARPVNATVF